MLFFLLKHPFACIGILHGLLTAALLEDKREFVELLIDWVDMSNYLDCATLESLYNGVDDPQFLRRIMRSYGVTIRKAPIFITDENDVPNKVIKLIIRRPQRRWINLLAVYNLQTKLLGKFYLRDSVS